MDKGVIYARFSSQSHNEQGERYKGKPFKGRTFDKWMLNEKYTGEFTFGGRRCDNMYPAIVDKDLFERVRKRLTANKYTAGGQATTKEPYLLTGKLFCANGQEKLNQVNHRIKPSNQCQV